MKKSPHSPKKAPKRNLKNQLKKQKRSKKRVILPKNSNGTTSWDELSKIIGYDAKSSKMSVANHSTSHSKHQSKDARNDENRQGTNFTSVRTLEKKGTIKDIGNSMSPLGKDKTNRDIVKDEVKKLNDGQAVPLKRVSKEAISRSVAMDCEMVGTGPRGEESMVARVSLVNSSGDCIYDVYVTPKDIVTDYRTAVSGIRPANLVDAKDLFEVQKEVLEHLRGKILVGHALKHDLDVLFISHPKQMIRDTARYKPFRQLVGGQTPSLKKLSAIILGMDIQKGEHSSVEDAQAVMLIYLRYKNEWEKALKLKRKQRKAQAERNAQ